MFYISYSFEIAALITGLILYFKLRPVIFRLLVILLIITVLNEGLSFFKFYKNAGVDKSYFYNFFFVVELITFFLIYKLNYKYKRHQEILTFIFLFSVFFAFLFFMVKGVGVFNPFFINAISLGLIGFGFFYYYTLYNSEEITTIKTNPLFWLSTGIIIVNFIHLLFVNATFVESFRNNPTSKEVFRIINTAGNIFYYSCIITCFICSSRFHKPDGT